ncbi:MAG: DEAD/DEAH box helicase [Magnetococcales bacterium]|nr:DEAD/DEAH box helicase [Magnetococcales bacterium]
MLDFNKLNLANPLQSALKQLGHQTPTPIQAQAIPPLLEGRDLLGIAQTGTGKTGAFALPILDRLLRKKRHAPRKGARVLILTPTRELAAQIDDSFRTYGKEMRLFRGLVFGGVNQNPQVRTMSRGVDVLTATPGRLLDLMQQGHIRLDKLETFVLDEADRMLDMGFINDIRKVIAVLPPQRQTLLFSATMPNEIATLAGGLLNRPIRVEITPQATTVDRIAQSLHYVAKADKLKLLQHLLKNSGEIKRTLIFSRTKHGADRISQRLEKSGIRAAAIHGNKSQNARQRALKSFRSGQVRVLVATDIAARGIDVPGVTHVINFDLPNEPESYVHRIGRTARAGADGAAISFCDALERPLLKDVERCIRQRIPVLEDHPFHSEEAANADPRQMAAKNKANASRSQQQRRGGRKQGGKPGARNSAAKRRGGKPGGTGSGTSQAGSASPNRSAVAGAPSGGKRRRRRRKAGPARQAA